MRPTLYTKNVSLGGEVVRAGPDRIVRLFEPVHGGDDIEESDVGSVGRRMRLRAILSTSEEMARTWLCLKLKPKVHRCRADSSIIDVA